MNKATKRVVAITGLAAAQTAAPATGRKTRAIRLRPAPSRPWASAPERGLNHQERQQLLAALLSSRTFDEACLVAGVTRGEALLARAHDPAFALAWDQTMEARIAEVTARLTDLAIGGLQRAMAPGEDGCAAIALGQWLAEGRRPPAGKAGRAVSAAGSGKADSARADSGSPGSKETGNAPATPLPAAEAARRVEALFATVEQRLRMAETLTAPRD